MWPLNGQTFSSRLERVQVQVVVPAKLDLIWAMKCNCAVCYLLELHIRYFNSKRRCAHKSDDECAFRAPSLHQILWLKTATK